MGAVSIAHAYGLVAEWRARHPEICEVWSNHKENTMQEKLIPFDLEEAKKNPERVRTRDYPAPVAVHKVGQYVALEFFNGGVELLSSERQAQQNLRLVAVPKTKQYRAYSIPGRSDFQLVAEERWYAADSDCRIFRIRDRIRDVSFDKATGIITVAYDE